MVSEQKSTHGTNYQPVCCNATLKLHLIKNDQYFVDFALHSEQLLPNSILMTNHLTAVINNTNAKSNSKFTTLHKQGVGSTAHKSAENVAIIEQMPEKLKLSTTAPPTPQLKEQSELKQSSLGLSSHDANGRSAALERAYVHDVYEQCEEASGAIRPRVAQFLKSLDPGSVVCDVGCGNGRYLTHCNPSIVTIGVDRCQRLSGEAKERGGEVLLSDNLDLPFLENSFDAVLSLAVIHHFATTERRVNALRELARVLRIGGRVIITVWALEQKNRRFESQDVLIPWQPNRIIPANCSDEEEEEVDFPPHYNAYTEESTNSSRSAGDGDSSSLSSSSPGESCYGFVRRALQKLAGRKQSWFLESKDTKNNNSIDLENARDFPIELRHLEDFEDITEISLGYNLKTRSLTSILNTPPHQIVRSRSSVPSLACSLYMNDAKITPPGNNTETQSANHSHSSSPAGSRSASSLSRRPKLIKQKQSLCDDESQLPEQPFHMISNYNSADNSITSTLCGPTTPNPNKLPQNSSTYLRKQSSFNEELMAGNRLIEKERVRKRIQKQTSLNEAFLCRSAIFGKRLQIIREGVTSSFKSSTGSLERATKNGLNKIMQNIKAPQPQTPLPKPAPTETSNETQPNCPQHQHQHHHHQAQRANYASVPYGSYFVHMLQRQLTNNSNKYTGGPVVYCNNTDCLSSACYCSTYQHGCTQCLQNEEQARRHSHESGSDSSKDGSLQSDTSVESEDSFASVIFIPRSELQQQQQQPQIQQQMQQQQFKQQHQNSNSSSSNSSSSNGGKNQLQQQQQHSYSNCIHGKNAQLQQHHHHHRQLCSAPTSPLVMPCPPTPAHSPAAAQMSVTSPPQTVAAVSAAMALLTSPNKMAAGVVNGVACDMSISVQPRFLKPTTNCFNFDEAHLIQQQQQQMEQIITKPLPVLTEKCAQEQDKQNQEKVIKDEKVVKEYLEPKITKEIIQNLPPIPKFRKQQSLQTFRPKFPIVRRSSATGTATSACIPKFLTLELFNPATDDLDSDSSEASSPDSVDSVISAHRSLTSINEDTELLIDKSESEQKTQNMEINVDTSLTENILTKRNPPRGYSSLQPKSKEECARFAEQLSAKLLECEKNNTQTEFVTLENVSDPSEYIEECLSAGKQKKGNNKEQQDFMSLREELRERRLMLANLSTQPSQQQSPTSSSTSSLSSQTRSSYDEDPERSYMLHLYENCKMNKLNGKRGRQFNMHSETALLLQDDSDYSTREEDYEHDVILEEDEEDVAAAEEEQINYNENLNSNVPLQTKPESIKQSDMKNVETTTTVEPATVTAACWDDSNSSNTSLDSPSQDGATTHHRYYHVFREGELDALINNHVTSLHIVSSYYERASWCIVAEKVQVWTI